MIVIEVKISTVLLPSLCNSLNGFYLTGRKDLVRKFGVLGKTIGNTI